MPSMTFGSNVPLSEQRYRVAMAKPCRKQPKKHATGKRNSFGARKSAALRKHAKIVQQVGQRKRSILARAFWRGEWVK